ncbi:hypothetical protein Y032_0045g1222 [Ancylostoma ceylanicum]|nr:hypothetical protein Y032_0045g1222 [Ancylostoma ceylanicum]
MNLMVTASFLQMNSLMEELSNTVVNCVHPSNRLAAYRKATIRNAPLAQKLWASIVKEFRLLLTAECNNTAILTDFEFEERSIAPHSFLSTERPLSNHCLMCTDTS